MYASLFALVFGAADTSADAQKLLMVVAQDFLDHMGRREFSDAAKLFYYPPSLKDEALSRDMEGLTLALQVYANEFGAAEHVKLLRSQPKFTFVSSGSGDDAYWQRHPRNVLVYVAVNFRQLGPGFIGWTFSDVKDRLVLSNVQFGVAETDEARTRMKLLAEKTALVIKAAEGHL